MSFRRGEVFVVDQGSFSTGTGSMVSVISDTTNDVVANVSVGGAGIAYPSNGLERKGMRATGSAIEANLALSL